MSVDQLRSQVRRWIDQDEKDANVAVDTFLSGCEAEGVAPTFEEYYGSIIFEDEAEFQGFSPAQCARIITLGYVLRGRLDDLMPAMSPKGEERP